LNESKRPEIGEIIQGFTQFTYDEFNICQFCFKKSPNDLSVWPCANCFKDHPIMYTFKPDFIPLDKIDLIKSLNGQNIFNAGRFGDSRFTQNKDESSKSGSGPCDNL